MKSDTKFYVITGTADNWAHAVCPTCDYYSFGQQQVHLMVGDDNLPHCTQCGQNYHPGMLKGPISKWTEKALKELKAKQERSGGKGEEL